MSGEANPKEVVASVDVDEVNMDASSRISRAAASSQVFIRIL